MRLKHDKHNFMAAYILQERQKPKEEREFKEFLEMLPNSCKDFPLFFTDEELAYLKGSYLLELVDLQRENLQNDYDIICQKVPDLKKFNF